jgi:hypothetical protein
MFSLKKLSIKVFFLEIKHFTDVGNYFCERRDESAYFILSKLRYQAAAADQVIGLHLYSKSLEIIGITKSRNQFVLP